MVDFEKAEAQYTGKDIELLGELEGIRKRPGVYIGSTNLSGLHHLIWEIVDNAVDEAVNGYGDKIYVTLEKDGSVEVRDEGRGIPCDIHEKTGMPAVQLAYTRLNAGGKFSNKVYASAAGLHGMGATVTNALSEWVDITICREGKIRHIAFEDGGKLKTPLEVLGPTSKHGTTVRFKPDKRIFQSVDFKFETVATHLQEQAFLLKGVRFFLKDERVKPALTREFYYQNGLREYVETLTSSKNVLGEIVYFDGKSGDLGIELAMAWCSGDYGENILSYANSVRTHDGGTHETGFKIGLNKAINDFAQEAGLIKEKDKLEGEDIREGLTAVLSVKIMDEEKLQFEGQTKGKLGTPDALPLTSGYVSQNFLYYLREHKEFAVDLIKKCQAAREARAAARRAKENARAGKKKGPELIISDKLAPAQSKDYDDNELFIVEGDSAGGTAKTGRDRLHQAILPLRGKPLNTENVTAEKMFGNAEFATLIQTIGAGVGDKFDPNGARYGKIIIMTDADTDGAHIQTLLLTFFYKYMKPLITRGMVYIAQPPLYRVYRKSNPSVFVYAWSDADLEEARTKIGQGYGIKRYKGLGEMNAHDLAETTMDKKTRVLLQVKIEDPVVCDRRIGVLMGNDSSKRREWIEENVVFNERDAFMDEVDR